MRQGRSGRTYSGAGADTEDIVIRSAASIQKRPVRVCPSKPPFRIRIVVSRHVRPSSASACGATTTSPSRPSSADQSCTSPNRNATRSARPTAGKSSKPTAPARVEAGVCLTSASGGGDALCFDIGCCRITTGMACDAGGSGTTSCATAVGGVRAAHKDTGAPMTITGRSSSHRPRRPPSPFTSCHCSK